MLTPAQVLFLEDEGEDSDSDDSDASERGLEDVQKRERNFPVALIVALEKAITKLKQTSGASSTLRTTN